MSASAPPAAERGMVVASWPIPPARPSLVWNVRSTILSSGLAALRARNLTGRYFELLPPEHHAGIESLIAGTWLPIGFAMAHYEACDALRLPYEEVLSVGLAVGARVHETLLMTVKKLASAAGVSPWAAFAQYDRLWHRTFEGGAFAVTRAGPKDVVVRITHLPLARFAYFRAAYCGVNLAGVRLFTRSAYVRLLPSTDTDHSFAFRMSWV